MRASRPGAALRDRPGAEQRPDALAKIIERLGERVADPESAEVSRQAYRLHTHAKESGT